eukprot:TRINITY_DN13202_c0_g1_i1.p1 TRINITY_DN13202_c0_g1~~TRINITY_DN13202_c0_g1_i1.p1  ORF type:complete len:227 (+),score=19.30 TRINITY_DN13202_c0_g1_i1:30-710(+)
MSNLLRFLLLAFVATGAAQYCECWPVFYDDSECSTNSFSWMHKVVPANNCHYVPSQQATWRPTNKCGGIQWRSNSSKCDIVPDEIPLRTCKAIPTGVTPPTGRTHWKWFCSPKTAVCTCSTTTFHSNTECKADTASRVEWWGVNRVCYNWGWFGGASLRLVDCNKAEVFNGRGCTGGSKVVKLDGKCGHDGGNSWKRKCSGATATTPGLLLAVVAGLGLFAQLWRA